MAEFQPVHHTGSQRHHIFQRSAQLDPDQIVICVDPKRRRHEERLNGFDGSGVLAGEAERRRFSLADFAGETGTRQDHQ